MATADWKKFTPASINKSQCMARTWAEGKGGQCKKDKGDKSDFCAGHATSDKYKVHGRVDGPISAAKLAQFVAESRKPEKPELTEEEKAARAEKRKAKGGSGNAEGDEERSPKRAKKDPNAPKRPAGGAFGCFLAANRKTFEKECPGAAITGVAKLASTKWKEASEADTKKYQKQYEEKKAAYDEAMKSYVPPAGVDVGNKRSFKKPKKDPNAPKRPAGGAFGCFLAANRKTFVKECPGDPIAGVTKLASTRWKAASEADTKKYQKQYEEKKAAYEKAMNSYVPPVAEVEGDAEKAAEESEEETMATMRRPASPVTVVKNALKKKPAAR